MKKTIPILISIVVAIVVPGGLLMLLCYYLTGKNGESSPDSLHNSS